MIAREKPHTAVPRQGKGGGAVLGGGGGKARVCVWPQRSFPRQA